jgi:hypothetical protein
MGHTLEHIHYHCGFHWDLTLLQRDITKENCFVMEHWQCCHKPAYQIVRIESDGALRLWGYGGWSGGYGGTISIKDLPAPNSPAELFVCEEGKG